MTENGEEPMSSYKLRNSILKIVPEIYRSDRTILKTLGIWFFIGLLIRLIFMPIACHGDLLSTYHRSFLILKGDGYIGWYIPSQLIQTLFLFFYQYILPLEDFLQFPEHSVTVSFWLENFSINILSYRALFLFKIPYLLLDFASAIVLLHIFKEKDGDLLSFKFWMINPVGIFAFYIFSRYEITAIFFILLSLLFAKKNMPYFSILSLGVGAWERAYPILFLPFYIFSLGKNLKSKVVLSLVGIAPFLLNYIGVKMVNYADIGNVSSTRPVTIFKTYFLGYILGMHFEIGSEQIIYIFISGTIFLAMFYIYSNQRDFDSLWEYPLLILLLFYSTCIFHPQYFAWVTPFFALAIVKFRKFLELYILQIICFVFYTFYGARALAGWLFAAVDPTFFIDIDSPSEFIGNFFPAIILINFFRSALSGVSIFMIGKILFGKLKCLEKFK